MTAGEAFGEFIRNQRRLAKLSQRELAKLAGFSDAYLSQIERGLHQPSVRIVTELARVLKVPADALLARMGFDDENIDDDATEMAIRTDNRLTDDQKSSMLDVYQAFISANEAST